MTISLSEIRDKLKPDVMGWINQAIASATLSGITLSLPSNVAYIDVEQTFTESQFFAVNKDDLSGTFYGGYAQINGIPAANTSAQLIGWEGVASTTGSNDFSGTMRGGVFVGIHGGTGTATAVNGLLFEGRNSSSGTITDVYALRGGVNNTGSGTITDGYAIYVSAGTNSGGGTFSNHAGITILDRAVGGNRTNLLMGNDTIPSGNYNIYVVSTWANYFAGNVGIGDTSPDSGLEIGAMSNAGYITLNEITAPGSPAANKLALYTADNGSGVTKLYSKNSAGSVYEYAAIGIAQSWSAVQTWSAINVFDAPSSWQEVSTPANPASGYNKIYPKSDDHWYILDSEGNETQLAEAGGATGDWIQISENTLNNTASTTDFTGLDSTYRAYVLVFRNVKPATDGANFLLRMSTDGGSTFISTNTYLYHSPALTSGATTYASNVSAGASTILLFSGEGNAASESLNGKVELWNLQSTANMKDVTWHLIGKDTSGNLIGGAGFGFQQTTSAVNAVRILTNGGNLASGTITLYGIV